MYQYERLVRASQLDFPASIMACSWGAFQVMGFFYYRMGYASPIALANAVMTGVDAQFDLFVAYMTKVSAGALEALQKRNWTNFAKHYNGLGYPAAFPQQMEQHYNEFK
ncbi:N-acetylmuramidase domain-containing protein [Paraburkholderia azotifigens]|nr:N-acetylmuramidase domain-containing protein [Paraburkholderia azotifigens]